MKLVMGLERHESPPLPVTQAFVWGDKSLACNALILMANLERFLARLADPAQPPAPDLVLEYLAHVTNQIMAFAEQLPDAVQPLSLSTLLGPETTTYRQRLGIAISDGRLSIASLAELSADPRTLRGLRNDILRVIHIYLNIFALTFNDTPLRELWLALFKGFHVDLVTTVNAL